MSVEKKIHALATAYALQLKKNMDDRVLKMEQDDQSHLPIYRTLGIPDEEGRMIDIYQNKGRFVYKYAGAFLEAAAKACFEEAFPDAATIRVPNKRGTKPKQFEVDCLVGTDALEIKWRDATTDGDHITKEHARIQAICDVGYRPIRVMFYYPNRDQAIKIQRALEAKYAEHGGEYYHSQAAWDYVKRRTKVDLLEILKRIKPPVSNAI
jgi:hypothetical protein